MRLVCDQTRKALPVCSPSMIASPAAPAQEATNAQRVRWSKRQRVSLTWPSLFSAVSAPTSSASPLAAQLVSSLSNSLIDDHPMDRTCLLRANQTVGINMAHRPLHTMDATTRRKQLGTDQGATMRRSSGARSNRQGNHPRSSIQHSYRKLT